MNDQVRIQVREDTAESEWQDVGHKAGQQKVPVFDQVANSLVPSQFDTILITYTDSTKATISSIVFKLGAATVSTLTPTFESTTDTWLKT